MSLSRRRVNAPVPYYQHMLNNRYAQQLAIRTAGRMARYGATRAYNWGERQYSKWTRPRQYRTIQSTRYGTQRVRVQRGKGKKKKLTLKKRIVKLEKNKVPNSTYQKVRTNFMHLRQSASGTVNASNKVLYNIRATTSAEINNDLTSVEFGTGVANLENRNTSVKTSSYQNLYIKNAGLHSVTVKYVKYVCADHTSIGPLNSARNEGIDRGLSISNAVVGSVAAAAGNSFVPEHLELTRAENCQSLIGKISGADNLYSCSKISTITLNPGDSTTIVHSLKHLFKTEILDIHTTGYIKKIDFGIMLEIVGELCHGGAAGTNDIVNYGDWYIDALNKKSVTYTIQNGLGLKDYAYNTDGNTPTAPANYIQAGANVEIE